MKPTNGHTNADQISQMIRLVIRIPNLGSVYLMKNILNPSFWSMISHVGCLTSLKPIPVLLNTP
jgi:hypothetical protein